MPNTFELIASSTVGAGGAASFSFTSIPSTFTDLCLYVSSRDNSSTDAKGQYYTVAINGGTGYSTRYLNGTGSAAASGSLAQLAGISTTALTTANTFNNDMIYFPNYAGSTAKSYSVDSVTENNATGAYAFFVAGLSTGTTAINTITLSPVSPAVFVQYSTAYLYGVKNA